MDDSALLELFIRRDQDAVAEAESRYGAYCRRVALNITGDERDAVECFSDALFAAWNSIPPAVPADLGAYLARLTRNSALDVIEKRRAHKRGSGAAETALSELGEIASALGDPAEEAEKKELAGAINDFVNGLSPEKRRLFAARYWWFYDINDIAERTGKSPESIRVSLFGMRGKLKNYLIKRGFII